MAAESCARKRLSLRAVSLDAATLEAPGGVQPWFECSLAGVVSATLEGKWRDQGYGNQKGAIHARVAAEDEEDSTAEDEEILPWRRIGGPAPHEEEDFTVALPEELFAACRPEAQLQLGVVVGGGGGHALHVPSATLLLEMDGTAMDTGDGESVDLPDVNSRIQSHAVQDWFSYDLDSLVSAKLHASWKDQGWGNQKGAIHVRVATPEKEIFPWRRVGPYPAPHDKTAVAIDMPKEFFEGRYSTTCLKVDEHSGHTIRIPNDDATAIATARYGANDAWKDVTDIVKQELAAGRKVRASNDLFGDPAPGVVKALEVTLMEDIQISEPMPADAQLQLGFEVGGGGGHSLTIADAKLALEKIVKVFLALPAGEDLQLASMAGEVVRESCGIAAGDSIADRDDKLRRAARAALGSGKGFKVILSSTNEIIPSR